MTPETPELQGDGVRLVVLAVPALSRPEKSAQSDRTSRIVRLVGLSHTGYQQPARTGGDMKKKEIRKGLTPQARRPHVRSWGLLTVLRFATPRPLLYS